jgi:hypothetical protein
MRIGLLLLVGVSVTKLVLAAFALSTHWLMAFCVPVLLGAGAGLSLWSLYLLWRSKTFVRSAFTTVPSFVFALGVPVLLWSDLPAGAGLVMLTASVATLSFVLLHAAESIGLNRHPLW